MLLKGYRKEIFRPECNPSFQSVHCMAHLDQDVGEVLPYLNAELSGASFTPAANALIWSKDGHKVAFHSHEIDVSQIESREWAEEAVNELVDLANRIWDRRGELSPSFETVQPLTPMTLFRQLPQTNCGECGESTCFNFALKLATSGVALQDCPPLLEPQYAGNLAALEAAIDAAGPVEGV
jgi:ArsR family metal-binding transcriptional regulator